MSRSYELLIFGLNYYYGTGVEQNYGEAAKCFRKAAEYGILEARKTLQNVWSL